MAHHLQVSTSTLPTQTIRNELPTATKAYRASISSIQRTTGRHSHSYHRHADLRRSARALPPRPLHPYPHLPPQRHQPRHQIPPLHPNHLHVFPAPHHYELTDGLGRTSKQHTPRHRRTNLHHRRCHPSLRAQHRLLPTHYTSVASTLWVAPCCVVGVSCALCYDSIVARGAHYVLGAVAVYFRSAYKTGRSCGADVWSDVLSGYFRLPGSAYIDQLSCFGGGEQGGQEAPNGG